MRQRPFSPGGGGREREGDSHILVYGICHFLRILFEKYISGSLFCLMNFLVKFSSGTKLDVLIVALRLINFRKTENFQSFFIKIKKMA